MFHISRQHILNAVILILTAALCVSCESEPAKAGSEAMRFAVSDVTRASLTDGSNITKAPFAVFGDMQLHGSSLLTVIHNGTVVRYDGREWTYSDTQYWFPQHEHSFVAIQPADSRWASDFEYLNNNLNFTYTQPSDYKLASDLLIAVHRRDYEEGATDHVGFNFAHILTNINVLLTYKGDNIVAPKNLRINGLTFKNIPVESTYSITPAPLTEGSKMTSDWVNDEGSLKGWTVNKRGNLQIEFSDEDPKIVEINSGKLRLFSDSDALLLLPNPIDHDATSELEIKYTKSTGEEETVSAVIPTGWNPGSTINLSLDIVNGMVQFSVSVEPWKKGSENNSTVPRK